MTDNNDLIGEFFHNEAGVLMEVVAAAPEKGGFWTLAFNESERTGRFLYSREFIQKNMLEIA